MRTPKQVILHALSNYRGDNYERAQIAFRGMSPAQMDQQYGQSGSTRQQVLDEYREHRDEVQAAIDYAKTSP